MDKNEIIERLERLARCAIHTVGELPFVMSLDDGIAIHEAIDMLRLSQPEPHWIPCSERLPEDEYVLISKKPKKYIGGDRWCVSIAIRIADPRSGKIQWRDSGFGVIQDDKVLAWMPLPEPYLEERRTDERQT